MQTLVTIFAGLLGLALGSFLNVCLSRWPVGESIVSPRSHCRNCDHTLAWWENLPLLSWLALRGRCKACRTPIPWRYPLVELIVGALWGFSAWQALRGWQGMDAFLSPRYASLNIANLLFNLGRKMILCWLLTALAFLDLENFWLPDWLTLTGAGLGCLFNLLHFGLQWILGSPAPELLRNGLLQSQRQQIVSLAVHYLLGILAAALLVLAVRWAYWLVRRREGIGLGDAKLMALLAAWLGFPPALLCLALAAVLGALVALLVLALPKARRQTASWSATKLPLGTFLCLGGMISTLWGPKIIAAYLRWAGL